MAIGTVAACIIVSHTNWMPIWHDAITGDGSSRVIPVEFIVASVISSIAPDLDESHSLLA